MLGFGTRGSGFARDSWAAQIPSPKSRIPSVSHFHRERRLGRREPRDRHAIRRRADVVEADLVEEVNRRRVAAVLAADPELQVGPAPTAALDAVAHEVADSLYVDRREGILLEDLLLLVDLQELPAVVARKPKGELRQVLRADREELRLARDLIGHEASAGDLDHRADEVL